MYKKTKDMDIDILNTHTQRNLYMVEFMLLLGG